MHLVKILLFVILSFSHEVLSQIPSSFNASLIAVMKDAKTSLPIYSWSGDDYYYLIDLDAPFTWKDCVVRHSEIPCFLEQGCKFPLSCRDPSCKEARSYDTHPSCPSLNITAKYGCNICAVNPFNPISKSCKLSQLTTDLLHMAKTDGRNPYGGAYSGFGQSFILSCAPSSLLRSLPKNVHGVVAFSWSGLSFPHQDPYLGDKFSLCLPGSSSAPGVIFLGDGPFYFTQFPKLDLRTILTYTPMIRKGSKSLGYYIKINRISIKGTPIPLPSLKSESVKLSTIVPYTTLRSDIYKAVVTSFSKATKNIPRVNAVKPFSLCLKASAIGSVRKGFRVPNIDLETESGKVWTISGDNSMKRATNGAACLAFVDGGLGMKDAIVIGTFQMENNFLFMDLDKQELGFSSSLSARGTSCSSFNFTYII